MNKFKTKERGIVLFVVLATILVVILLANVILSIISSQSRLTHHQVSRIQAYYAAQAGINYAYEMLRKGTWATPSSSSDPVQEYTLCNGCTGANKIDEPSLPSSVKEVKITVYPKGNSSCQNPPSGVPACITAKADYSYSQE